MKFEKKGKKDTEKTTQVFQKPKMKKIENLKLLEM